MADGKLELADILNALDKKNVDFYKNLTTEQQKQIQPFVLMRFLTGTYNKGQIILVNELVNPYSFSLYTHKDLLWKLLTICTTGKSQRYAWNKTLSNKSAKPVITQVVQEYFQYNRKDAEQVVSLLSPDDIIQMAEELGWQDDETNKIRKELGLQAVKITKAKKKSMKITDPENFEW